MGINKVQVKLADCSIHVMDEVKAVYWASDSADELIRVARSNGCSVARLSITGAQASKDAVLTVRYVS